MPASASTTKWLAVAMTTNVVETGYIHSSQRSRRRVLRKTASATQNAQATCKLGIAAYRLTRPCTPCGSPAPKMLRDTSVSVSPDIAKRGGATGNNQYVTNPVTVVDANTRRHCRYSARRRRQSQTRTDGVTTKCNVE